MEEITIKNLSGWQNKEYVIVGYTDILDVEEFISLNVSAFNKDGYKVAIINLNTDSFYSIKEPRNTIVLQNCNSIFELRKCARLSVRENEVQVFFIDNLKLVNYQCLYMNSNIDNIISRSVRGLCRELGRPIISIVPISLTKNSSELFDIKCIGELAADADVVIFLKRDDKNRLKLLIAKNRNGFISDIYCCPNQNDNLEMPF